MAVGTGVKHLRVKDVEQLPIPLPPLNEQKRIVAAIESLRDRSQKARLTLSAIPELCDKFRQSVLAAALRGDLTADWREQKLGCLDEEIQTIKITEYYSHEIIAPKIWEKYSFKEACTLIGGSQPPKENFVNEPKDEYIRLIQIRDYKSDRFVTYIPLRLAKRFCAKDDIMIGRYGPPIFQILRGLEGAYNVALMKAEPDLEKIDRAFYIIFFKTLISSVMSPLAL